MIISRVLDIVYKMIISLVCDICIFPVIGFTWYVHKYVKRFNLLCYMFKQCYAYMNGLHYQSNGGNYIYSRTNNYFDIKMEVCLLARMFDDMKDDNNKDCEDLNFNFMDGVLDQTAIPADYCSKLRRAVTRNEGDEGDRVKNEGDVAFRLEGASIYPTDLNFTEGQTSAHHPWQCSLRTRGYRGRHRCGVTLLSGPTEESPTDPFVLVGAAHCNYICKDRVTGDPLETCCCRPEDNDSSCKDVGGKTQFIELKYFQSEKSLLWKFSDFGLGTAKGPIDNLWRVQLRRGDSV